MRIGSWYIGIRKANTKTFKWFYRPLMTTTEEEENITMWWIGWHLYVIHKGIVHRRRK